MSVLLLLLLLFHKIRNGKKKKTKQNKNKTKQLFEMKWREFIGAFLIQIEQQHAISKAV